MDFKKAFTLAEILIVLMVIGALATMTVPSLMKGVEEARYKTAYKKALNSITNFAGTLRVNGELPSMITSDNTLRLFDALNSNLSTKGYVLASQEGDPLNGGKIAPISAIKENIDDMKTNNGRHWYWIITEDNMAYLLRKGSTNTGENVGSDASCGSKFQILASQENGGVVASNADICYTIYVDVNGLNQGPNKAYIPTENQIEATDKMPALKYDRFPIYLGIDGATAGNIKTTITGRIAADIR